MVVTLGAAIVADVVVVVQLVLHGRAAQRAEGPVVVHAVVLFCGPGPGLQPKPLHRVALVGKAGHQGIVGVEHQGGGGVNGGENGVIHPLGVSVAGELIPVEVGDDEVGGVEPVEGVAGVPLVAL